jgi:4-oxalocrotonate tautomerase
MQAFCDLAAMRQVDDADPLIEREVLVMPLINVKIIEGVFDQSQKQEIVSRLTDAMVTIEGENMRPVTWCVVEEVRSGDWGIGGNPLATSDVKALAAGQAAVT